jgi:hypothetical protein
LAPIRKAAKTIKDHIANIMTYFQHRVTNAYKTPEDLIIEIGRDLDKKYTVLPEAFRTERKRCLDLRVQKMKTEDNEHS